MNMMARIMMICLLFSLGIVGLFVSNIYMAQQVLHEVTLPQVRESLRDKYKSTIKEAVDVQAQNLAQRVKGLSDKKEIYALIEKETDYQRFLPADEGYFFTYDPKGNRINVPVNKSSNGKNLMHLVDSNGVYFVRLLVENGLKGGDFSEYIYDKPGAGVQPKLAYSRMVPGTDVIIGTGMYIDSVEKEQGRVFALIEKQNKQYMLWQAGVLGFILLVTWSAGFMVARSLISPLRVLTQAAGEVARGNYNAKVNLSPRAPRNVHVLNEALVDMMTKLRSNIDEAAAQSAVAKANSEKVSKALEEAEASRAEAEQARRQGVLEAAGALETVVENVTNASTELSAQLRQIEAGAAEQASRAVQTVTTVEDMSSTVNAVARTATTAADNAQDALEKAKDGGVIVQKAVEGIRIVQQQSLKLKKDMDLLGEHTNSITEIMSVISDIADQTNLLALNAAIEAARAGDAGRGFAVVADEVRKLAEKTIHSTSDVDKAIKGIQASANESIRQVDDAVNKIEEVTGQIITSGDTLNLITHKVNATSNEMRSIATSTNQQATASNAISDAVQQVSAIAGQTLSSMESANEVVRSLAKQAQVLSNLIENMKK